MTHILTALLVVCRLGIMANMDVAHPKLTELVFSPCAQFMLHLSLSHYKRLRLHTEDIRDALYRLILCYTAATVHLYPAACMEGLLHMLPLGQII